MDVRAQFTLVQTPQAPNAARHSKRYRCNHCVSHCQRNGLAPPPTIAGRTDSLEKHLLVCRYTPRDIPPTVWPSASAQSQAQPSVQPVAQSRPASAHPQVQRSTKPAAQARPASARPQPQRNTAAQARPASARTPAGAADADTLQEMLMNMVVDLNLPFEMVSGHAFQKLAKFMNPGVQSLLPTAEDLGGRILNEQAAKRDAELRTALRIKQDETGGRVNLLGDYVCSIKRRHAIGCRLSLFGCEVMEAYKTCEYPADGVNLLYRMDESLRRAVAGGWKVGAVITESTIVSAQTRRMLAPRWPKIAFLPCLAYDTNGLLQLVLQGPLYKVIMEAMNIIDHLHMPDTNWLEKAVKIMNEVYGRAFKIFWIEEEQWGSLQAGLASLLRVRTALIMFFNKHNGDAKFFEHFKPLGDQDFWQQLVHAEALISPLVAASYRFDQHINTLADAVTIFHEMYQVFAHPSAGNQAMLNRLEIMWKNREQPLFLLGLYLHPTFRDDVARLNSTAISNNHVVTEFAVYYYRRFIGGRLSHLREEIDEWLCGGGAPVLAEDVVSTPVGYWTRMQELQQFPSLSRLAIAVLSIAINAAPCDYPFVPHGPVKVPGKKLADVNVQCKRRIICMTLKEKPKETDPPEKRFLIISPLESSLTTPTVQAERVLTGDPEEEGEEFRTSDCPYLWREGLVKFLKKMDLGVEMPVQSEEPDFSISFDDEPIPAAIQGPLLHSYGFADEEPAVLEGVRGMKVKLSTLFGTQSP